MAAPNPQTRGMDAWHRLIRFMGQVQAELEAHLLEISGLRPPDWDVIAQLGRADAPLVMSDLADRLAFKPTRLSNRVRRLEEAGLVERLTNEADARSTLLRLTRKGRGLLEKARPAHRAWIAERFAGRLSAEELGQLEKCLRALTDSDAGGAE